MSPVSKKFEGSNRLSGKSDEEVESLYKRGRDMLARDGYVPRDTDESHAIARVLRKSGVFGDAAARAGLNELDDSPKSARQSRPIRRDVRVDYYDHL